jgi:hypothetical protein
MRTEFLAGGFSGFAVDLSAKLCALAHFCLRALREPRPSHRDFAMPGHKIFCARCIDRSVVG